MHGVIRGGRVDRPVRVPRPRATAGRTRDELYAEAKALGIEGRSKMDKAQLEAAIDRKRGRR